MDGGAGDGLAGFAEFEGGIRVGWFRVITDIWRLFIGRHVDVSWSIFQNVNVMRFKG